MWKFFGKAQFPHSFGRIAFKQNFHSRKLGAITVFYAVGKTTSVNDRNRTVSRLKCWKLMRFSEDYHFRLWDAMMFLKIT